MRRALIRQPCGCLNCDLFDSGISMISNPVNPIILIGLAQFNDFTLTLKRLMQITVIPAKAGIQNIPITRTHSRPREASGFLPSQE